MAANAGWVNVGTDHYTAGVRRRVDPLLVEGDGPGLLPAHPAAFDHCRRRRGPTATAPARGRPNSPPWRWKPGSPATPSTESRTCSPSNLEDLTGDQFAKIIGTLDTHAGGQQVAVTWIAKGDAPQRPQPARPHHQVHPRSTPCTLGLGQDDTRSYRGLQGLRRMGFSQLSYTARR